MYWLIYVAPIWVGEHDWPVVWSHVYVGELAGVSPTSLTTAAHSNFHQYLRHWVPKVSLTCLDPLSNTPNGFSGGPAGLIYGFTLIWIGNFSVFICIGELASAVPTAGGQYHWVSLLAPRANKRFFSYITGQSRMAML